MSQKKDISTALSLNIGESIKEAIQNVSGGGAYQLKLLLFFLTASFFINLQHQSSSLYYMNPVFECEGIQGKASEEQACQIISFCKIIDPGTITAELELYCDGRKGTRTLLQTTAAFGNLLGLFLGGWFSDRKGRKISFCIALFFFNLTSACQLLGVNSKNVNLLLVAEFIAGMFGKVAYLNFLLLLTRFMKRSGYEAGTLGWLIVGNGVSQMIIAGLNAVFGNWRPIAYFYSVGLVLVSFAGLYLLKEDPVFLFDSGKLKQSKAIIEEIGEENGEQFNKNQQNLKRVDYAFEAKMLQIEHGPRGKSIFTLKDVMRCDIFQAALILGLTGCLINMVGKSLELSIQSFKFSYNLNLFVLGLSNALGYLTAIYVAKAEPHRKRGLIFTSLLYGAIAMIFLFPFCTQNGAVETVAVFVLRFLLCWSSNFYIRLKVDSFPEKYQMTIMATIELLVNVGTMISPKVVQMALDNKMNPIVFMNVLRIIFGTLPVFLLNETKITLDEPVQAETAKKLQEINI